MFAGGSTNLMNLSGLNAPNQKLSPTNKTEEGQSVPRQIISVYP